MDTHINYLNVLSDSLDKKIIILKELLTLTEQQKKIVEETNFEDDQFNENLEKKTALINEIQKLDKGFQTLYDNISRQLEANKENYKNEIKELQSKITTVLDLNAGLQVAEARNKELIEKKFASLKKEVREIKKSRTMAANYYRNMNNITTEPHFLDKKK